MEKKPTPRAVALLPVAVFLVLYLVLGIILEYVLKIKMGFYQIPIVVAFLVALLVACLQNRGVSFDEKLELMGQGIGDKNIVTMILIFLVAGIFVGVTGRSSAEAVAYFLLSIAPVLTPDRRNEVAVELSNVEISFEDGEILVRGSSVMKGYYQMPEETAEALRGGWLHTGDKGYLDKDGFLFINGRIKNLIILSNGENISPEEIENKLALGKLVGEVIVTGENNGLIARIYPDQDAVSAKRMNEETIRSELQAFIDSYNNTQPTYRRITGLVIRKYPFIKSATKKIKRQEVLIDEAL